MVINDLKQTCRTCRGSGRQPGRDQWGITQINPSGRCHTCEGRGFVLTELGQELVKLLTPFIRELIAEERRTEARPEAADPATEPPERTGGATPREGKP